jgi:hypothetical protein
VFIHFLTHRIAYILLILIIVCSWIKILNIVDKRAQLFVNKWKYLKKTQYVEILNQKIVQTYNQ